MVQAQRRKLSCLSQRNAGPGTGQPTARQRPSAPLSDSWLCHASESLARSKRFAPRILPTMHSRDELLIRRHAAKNRLGTFNGAFASGVEPRALSPSLCRLCRGIDSGEHHRCRVSLQVKRNRLFAQRCQAWRRLETRTWEWRATGNAGRQQHASSPVVKLESPPSVRRSWHRPDTWMPGFPQASPAIAITAGKSTGVPAGIREQAGARQRG